MGRMETVSFTRMTDATQADYDILMPLEKAYNAQLPTRLLTALRELGASLDGYRVSRLEHSLQAATRALRDGRDEEYVATALVHDVGDALAPYSHSELAAAIVRPFVRPELYWITRHHGAFQLHYYGQFIGENQQAREEFRGHEFYDACAEFCELYDQASFDPSYESLPLAFFEDLVHRVFGTPRYL